MSLDFTFFNKYSRKKKKDRKAYDDAKAQTKAEFEEILDDHFSKKFEDLFLNKGNDVAFYFLNQIQEIRERNSAAEAEDNSDFRFKSLDDPVQPPHILFILVDDLGYADVGYHSNDVSTPNIDYLVEDLKKKLNQKLHRTLPSYFFWKSKFIIPMTYIEYHIYD